MKAYFGVPISPNITETPDGFYVCKNVPIARTGWYEYTGEELGLNDRDKIYKVYRSPEEVFKPAAIASFNGKVVTNEHPSEWVTPDNAKIYMKGTSQNIRQSKGEPDLLLADLIIYDADLIKAIQEGKREVSCGYDCNYVDNGDGTYSQTDICGNHIAVVEAGRAGNRVAIKDSKNKIEEGEKKMGSKIKLPTKKHSRVTDFLAAMGLKHFATDAEPEEVMDAVDAMAEEKKCNDEEPPAEEKKEEAKDQSPELESKIDKICDLICQQLGIKPQEDEAPTGIEAKLEKLNDSIKALAEKKNESEEDPEKAIDEVISKLEGSKGEDEDLPDEEEVTIEPEEITDEEPKEEEEKSPAKDSFYKAQFLKQMKPIVAQIQDKAAKKKACDALINTVRMKAPQGKDNSYAAIVKGRKKKAADKQKMSDAEYQEKVQNLGMEIAKKFNPHYKEVK